ncbi:sulfatase [Nonomuraea sp. K274]|uniref:Sulfatase n=1 Tax=Nonomuraea cypriaca TaxID=1187855 RepID=A0A931A8V1_9ACTN|nr:sulfatase [Nonomuraea cypriaca]MBF8188517.1 sulfatase [Nonomuraea cypriaca]
MAETHGLSRRAILGGGLGLAAAVATGRPGSASAATAGGTAQRPPNIVLIMLDDVGYGDWSSYGSTEIQTPRIDALASAGTRFTQMYAGGPVCTPARAALLTGRYPQRVGLPWVVKPGAREGVSAYEQTLGEVLRAAGYRTGIFGKWHLGDPAVRPELNPVKHGFDTFFGTPQSNQKEEFALYDGEKIVEMLGPKEQVFLSRRCTDKAIDFIKQNKDRPFFAYVPYNTAHTPYHVQERFQGSSKAGPYGDLIQQSDFHIGRVLDELKANGLTDDTLVVITSDNGPVAAGTGGLRGKKGSTFEGGIRIPFVMRWPGRIQPKSTFEQPACFTDVLPTLAAATGGAVPKDRPIDGIDLAPALLGGAKPDRTLYHYHNWSLNAVRSGAWKLHVAVQETPAPELPLLYNIDEDKGEQRNLADQHPEKVKQLTEAAAAFGKEIEAQRAEALRRARGEA